MNKEIEITKEQLVEAVDMMKDDYINEDNVDKITLRGHKVYLDDELFLKLNDNQTNQLRSKTVDYDGWRDVYKRKLEAKGWWNVDFTSQMEDVIYCDDNVDSGTVPLATVVEEIIWYWVGKLKDPDTSTYKEFSAYEKRQFKKISNNFLKKYGDKDLAGSYIKYKSLLDFTDDDKVLLK